jgi:head-tail adaptor
MGMNASKLDRKITILRSELIDDGFGTVQGPFVALGSPIWAHRHDITDGEKWRAAEVAASVTTRFTVRSSAYSRGIKPQDRIRHDGLDFNIVGIKESADGRLQFIELTASARTDQ